MLYMVGMTAWGYRSYLPIFIIAGSFLLGVILELGTRRARRNT